MVSIYSYNIAEGKLYSPEPEQLPELLEAENVDLWVDLESPTPEENEILKNVFDFHELAIEDCIEANIEEPKLDDYEDYLFIVIHSVVFKSDLLTFDIIELDMFFGKNFVVTYHKIPSFTINPLK
jgi:magnesium transporter